MSKKQKKSFIAGKENSPIYDRFEAYFSNSTERLKEYKDNEKWFNGDPDMIWATEDRAWYPKVYPNILEATIRQKVALLTDSKPKIYVYSIPEAELLDNEEHIKAIMQHSQDMNMAFSSLWRFNQMHTILEQMVLYGSIYGLMAGRCYWDPSARGNGQIRTEALRARNIFFDEEVQRTELLDGSTETLIVAQLKPAAWFTHYYPDVDLSDNKANPSDHTELRADPTKTPVEDYQLYLEAYHPASLLDENAEDPGQLTMTSMCGNIQLASKAVDFVPVFMHPYELALDSARGTGDVSRLSSLSKDFCSKVSQVSLNIALSACRQYVVNPAKMGMKIQDLIEHVGEPGYMFFTRKLAEDVKNALVDLETPKFNPELFQYIYFLPQLMEAVSGLAKVLSGQAAKRERQSKFEVGKQYEAATIRIRNTAHHIEMMMVDMGKIWAAMINTYYTSPRRIFRINASSNKMETSLFQLPKNAKGGKADLDYVIVVQPDSTLPIDIQGQAERDMQLASMQAIDPRTLLESLNHPKVDAIMERLKEMQQQQQGQQGPGAQARTAPTKGTQAKF